MRVKTGGILILLVLVIFLFFYWQTKPLVVSVVFDFPSQREIITSGGIRYSFPQEFEHYFLREEIIEDETLVAKNGLDEIVKDLIVEYEEMVIDKDYTFAKNFYGNWENLIVRKNGLYYASIENRIENNEYMWNLSHFIIEKRPGLILANDHMVTAAGVRAAKSICNNCRLGIIVFDHHLDGIVNPPINGSYPLTCGSFLGVLLQENTIDYVAVVGVEKEQLWISLERYEYVNKTSVYFLEDVERYGVENIIKNATDILKDKGIGHIYLSIDMDVLDKEEYFGFRYNGPNNVREEYVKAKKEGRQINWTEDEFLEKWDRTGINSKQLLDGVESVYRYARINNQRILLQDISELTWAYDINNKTWLLAAGLSELMLNNFNRWI